MSLVLLGVDEPISNLLEIKGMLKDLLALFLELGEYVSGMYI